MDYLIDEFFNDEDEDFIRETLQKLSETRVEEYDCYIKETPEGEIEITVIKK